MTGDVAGDMVTGALAARAVEPRAGDAGHGKSQALCLNCGTRLIGEHCHRCGQSGHVHRTAGAIGHELAHGVFHFEGRIWRTLPMLALRPGELTRRYVAGERARFVSPLALFLFSVFLMFAVVANLPGTGFDGEGFAVNADLDETRAQVADQLGKARGGLARDERRLAELRREPGDDPSAPGRIAAQVAETKRMITGLERAQQVLPAPENKTAATSEADGWLEAKYRHARENPKLLVYKVKTSAYKYSWALIPLSLPFIWLLFPLRRNLGLYDHAVFATYSLCFMSLFVVALAVLATVGVPTALVVLAALIVPPFHIYKQLKGAYRLSRAGALWRAAWLLFFTSFTTTAFALLLLTINLAD